MVWFLVFVWVYVVLRGLFQGEIDELPKLIGFAFGALIYPAIWTAIFLVLSAFGVITIHWGV